jgi:choline kinase
MLERTLQQQGRSIWRIILKAFILAAGIGKRLGIEHPKCLLEFNRQTLLQRHLDTLKKLGIDEAFVAVGHMADQVTNKIDDLGYTDYAKPVFNPDYEAGSIVSLWCLHEELAYGGDVLLMDADVLYDEQMLQRLIDTKHANCFLLDRDLEEGDEPVKLCVRDGILVEFRKQLSPDLTYDIHGESVGFFRFDREMSKRLVARMDSILKDNRHDEPHEEVIRELLLERPEDFSFEDVTGIPWLEIDFPEDIEKARKQILPKLL